MGGDIYTLSQILGHSSVQVTDQCYLDLKTKDLIKNYQRFSSLINLKRDKKFLYYITLCSKCHNINGENEVLRVF